MKRKKNMMNFVELDEYLKQLAVYIEAYKESKNLQVLDFWDTTIRVAIQMAENYLNGIQTPIAYYAINDKGVPKSYIAEYQTMKKHLHRMDSWIEEINLNMYRMEKLQEDAKGN